MWAVVALAFALAATIVRTRIGETGARPQRAFSNGKEPWQVRVIAAVAAALPALLLLPALLRYRAAPAQQRPARPQDLPLAAPEGEQPRFLRRGVSEHELVVQ
mmetsp:Transcript_119547/g.333553  ORF Transcript_119547/g.333553 Transcript_119547/m.333553 type:complete len:103 (+) Transcript_119547:1347-1655(+)